MIRQPAATLAELYETDETAWLETMAELIGQGRWQELDYAHLQEYLNDMARRDRREVESRLVVLLTHVLKWVYQPDQRAELARYADRAGQELMSLVAGGELRNRAETVLAAAYTRAVERASAETGLAADACAAECPYTLAELLAPDFPGD